MNLYHEVSFEISKIITKKFSTSFSFGVRALNKNYRSAIYSIYGLVRVADEIVDSYHESNKEELLLRFKSDTYKAIEEKISTNPVINAFQLTVNKYNIPLDLIEAFFKSMQMDIFQGTYSRQDYDKYVYGSAEVIGLMCLKVFLDGDEDKYQSLINPACALGSAFQKVNFLRDLGSDLKERNRIYIPEIFSVEQITEESKKLLEKEIEKEFEIALDGIKKLPESVKLGVYVAYLYYRALLKKVRLASIQTLKHKRIRVNNFIKLILFLVAFFKVTILKHI